MAAWLESQSNFIMEVRKSFKHRGVESSLIVKPESSAAGQVRDFHSRLVVKCLIGSLQRFIRRTCRSLFVHPRGVRFLTWEFQAIDNCAEGSRLLKQQLRRGRATYISSFAEKENDSTKSARFIL
jgi:hypothetical protein